MCAVCFPIAGHISSFCLLFVYCNTWQVSIEQRSQDQSGGIYNSCTCSMGGQGYMVVNELSLRASVGLLP